MSRIPDDLRLQWGAFFYVDDYARRKGKGLTQHAWCSSSGKNDGKSLVHPECQIGRLGLKFAANLFRKCMSGLHVSEHVVPQAPKLQKLCKATNLTLPQHRDI